MNDDRYETLLRRVVNDPASFSAMDLETIVRSTPSSKRFLMPIVAAVIATTGVLWLSTAFHSVPEVVPATLAEHGTPANHPVAEAMSGASAHVAATPPSAAAPRHVVPRGGTTAASAVGSPYPRVQTAPLTEAELAVLGIVVHDLDDEVTLAMVHDLGPGGPRMLTAYGAERTYSRSLKHGEEVAVPAVPVAPELVTTAAGITRETRTTDITIDGSTLARTVSSKPVIEIYLQPGDTMSVDRQAALEADSSIERVRVRRLTQAQADSMAAAARQREHAMAAMMRTNELVGVRLRSDRQQSVPELIFWYRPTPAFVAMLPQNVASIVRDELAGTARQCQFVQRCQETSSVVRASAVTPNPASTSATLTVDMAASVRIRCVLRSIDGGVLRMVREGDLLPPGPSSITVPVGDLDNGVYLVSIEPEDGNGSIVQRIVVRH